MESMEGRLMLATTVIDFLPSGLTPVEIGIDADQPAFTASPLPFAPSPREGGFITPPFVPGTDSLDFSPADDPSTPQTNPTNSVIQSSADTNSNSTKETNHTTSDVTLPTGSPAGLGGLHLFDSSGIQPAVISSLETLRSTSGFLGPVLAANYRDEPQRDEGGPISIAAVLNDIRNLEHSEPQEPAPSQLADTTNTDASATNRLADASHAADRQISGELARAIVFEIAGDEPANASGTSRADRLHLNDQPGDRANPDAYRPVSYHDEFGPGRDSNTEQVSRTMLTRPVTLVRHEAGADTISPALQTARRSDENGGELLPPMPLSERKPAVSAVSASSSSAELQLAYAQVYEHLGEEAEAVADPPATVFSWGTALNATPLLMVLALERIAASNSRRAGRHEAFVSTNKTLARKRTFERLTESS